MNNSPPYFSIPKKPKPIVTPSPEVDFVDSSTQFENSKVNLESQLEYLFDPNQPITYIYIVPYLVPNSQIQQVHWITWAYS